MSNEVFDAVADFLQFCGMNSTLAVFQSERLSVPPIEEIARQRSDSQAEFKRDLINSLATGDCQRFRSLWNSKWAAAPDQNAQQLLFLCEVFFAVFPLHPANRVKFGDISDSLRRFKEFLDTHASDLSASTEFLPFYALPYIPNPADHPSFKHIFTVEWFTTLKKRLSDWLDRQLTSQQLPLIVTAIRSPTDKMASTDSELWSAALELADALQHAMVGDMPTRERVDAMFRRIGIFAGGAVKFTATTDFSPLDFARVKKDLLNPDSAAPLLKACVNRLTRSPAEHVRRFFIELIEGDIFDVAKGKILPGLLKSNGPARVYCLRLMNILATDSPGRIYLYKHPKIINLLKDLLKEEDSSDMMNIVGILQKLSLMKDAKLEMINSGIFDFALKMLSDPTRYSDYTAEYTAALVMNLSSRHECAQKYLKNDGLSILAELSGAQNPQLQSYAIVLLAQLFIKEPQLRERAKAIGLPVLFDQMRQNADPNVAEEIDLVIKAMAGEVEDTGDTDADDDDAGSMFDAYEEVGDEQWTFESEGEALLAKYVITDSGANQKAANIDNSLRLSMARMSVAPDGQHSARRPVTPGKQ